MIGTYAAVLAVCAASLAIGQAAIGLCGRPQWSWLSPAVGLALLCGICWGTVRLPGGGAISAVAVLLATLAAGAFLWRGGQNIGRALLSGLPVALLALAAVSLPFAAEGHFGILGTGFNPDMSQHLLASARLAEGVGSPLLHQGYPMGPHAIVVALNKGLGIGLVQGFDGLTIAVAVLASLTALAAFEGFPPLQRVPAALLVGIPYMAASYFAQGAFKETMQALFVLAFVLSLREVSINADWRDLPLHFVPAALIAIGSIYVYSFPGLIWLAGALVLWLAVEYLRATRQTATAATGPAALQSLSLALLVFIVGTAPELGRMIDFHSFETFDPNGPGLGNLFGQISPFEALGIWPSGDFRLSPGAGAVPALGYYFGAAFACLLLLYGLVLCWRRRETAVVAGLLAAAAAYGAARIGGTPYTAAKAIEIAAPLAVLVIVLPLFRRPVGILYLLAAGACSLLALVNAPVGPTSYSPALTGLRPLIASGSTLVLASPQLLEEEQGQRYIAWELRGGRICIAAEGEAGRGLPAGVRFVVTGAGGTGIQSGASGGGTPARPPFAGLRLRHRADPYLLWETIRPPRGASPCPLIAVRQARQGPAR